MKTEHHIFGCVSCGNRLLIKRGEDVTFEGVDCCRNPRYLISIWGNHGNKTMITWGEYLSYERNGMVSQNKEGEDVLNIFVDSKEQIVEDNNKEILSQFLRLTKGREKEWSKATEILVEYINNKIKIYCTKDDIKSEMWVYKEGIYIPQGKSEIKILLRELLREWYTQYVFGLVVAKLEADNFIDSDEFFNNVSKEEVPLLNGILNIYTKELTEFDEDKIFFNKLPVNYNPESECPKIEEFLKQILSSEDDKKVFYEWGGFNLTNEYTFEKALMCIGSGRNGKDKMIELLKRLLGVENCISIPLNSLDPSNFALSELFGKKANIAGDISSGDLKDLSMFKALTGRSLVSAKRKFLRNITFVNSAKFTFACNELPMVYDLSKGFWDRWILLEFPYTFVTQNEFNREKNKEKLKIRDESIIDKISSPEELSGLLNAFLRGLERLLKNRGFSITKGSEDIKNLWIRKSNSFIAFCMDKIEENYEGKITKRDLRIQYSKYCKKHKVQTKSDIVIKRVLQDMFGVGESQQLELGLRSWEGIQWKN